jgi:YggT family protein
MTFEALILGLVQLYFYVVIASVVLSWLVGFDVINIRNRLARFIYDSCNALVDPALKPIRRVVPLVGSLDFSPLILLILLQVIQILIVKFWPPGL